MLLFIGSRKLIQKSFLRPDLSLKLQAWKSDGIADCLANTVYNHNLAFIRNGSSSDSVRLPFSLSFSYESQITLNQSMQYNGQSPNFETGLKVIKGQSGLPHVRRCFYDVPLNHPFNTKMINWWLFFYKSPPCCQFALNFKEYRYYRNIDDVTLFSFTITFEFFRILIGVCLLVLDARRIRVEKPARSGRREAFKLSLSLCIRLYGSINRQLSLARSAAFGEIVPDESLKLISSTTFSASCSGPSTCWPDRFEQIKKPISAH